MKRLFIVLLSMLLAGLCACGQVEPIEETTAMPTTTAAPIVTKFDVGDIALYADEIERILKSYGDDSIILQLEYYAFYDLDSNGTKELLLGLDTYWAEEVVTAIEHICVIHGGVAIWPRGFFWDSIAAWEFDDTVVTVLYKNGTIMMNYNGRDKYYRLEAGEIKCTSLIEEDGKYYSFNDYEYDLRTSITKEEFDRIRKEFEGDGQTVELDWRPLSEYEQSKKD